jgi:hypothetical protein
MFVGLDRLEGRDLPEAESEATIVGIKELRSHRVGRAGQESNGHHPQSARIRQPRACMNQEDRRKVQKATFDLHHIHSTDSSRSTEEMVDQFTESERELIGSVFP